MNYCSHCGSNEVKLTLPPNDHLPRYICQNCGTVHYQNPNVIVGCVICQEGKIMLCKRGIEPRMHYWNLPAGFLENGETVEEGAIRETYEETLAKVRILHLHSVFSIPHVNQVNLHFVAEMLGTTYQTTHESTEIQFFAPEDIPWEDIAFNSHTFSIKTFLENREQNSEQVHIGQYVKKKK